MDMDRVRIADVITAEYSDFLSFCSASGKIFISELTNVDFVAFRTSSGQSRDYIKSIRAMLIGSCSPRFATIRIISRPNQQRLLSPSRWS